MLGGGGLAAALAVRALPHAGRGMVLVFFVYGLAFFSMGFAIALESRQSSGLRLAACLRYLAAFGILHSLVEWADMLLLMESASPPIFDMETTRMVRTLLLGVSTGALVQFGVELISHQPAGTGRLGGEETRGRGDAGTRRTQYSEPSTQDSALGTQHPELITHHSSLITHLGSGRWLRFLPLGLGLVWVGVLALLVMVYPPLGSRQWLIHADVWARYLLYLPGSVLAGFGLVSEARSLEKGDFRSVARDARFAAATFLLNAVVAGLVVPPGQRFPELPINYDLFQAVFGIPVQILRAASAVAIAYFVLRVLRVFRIQSARQVEVANQHRLLAQQEALDAQRRVQEEMEQWNRELENRIQQRTAEITLRNRQLLAINSIAASISQSFDLQRILSEALQKTVEALDAEGGGIFLSGEGSGSPPTQLCRGLPEDFAKTVSKTRLDAVVMGQLADTGETGGPGSPPPGGEAPSRSSTLHWFLTAPVKARGMVAGAICVARTRESGFSPEDGRLLTAIGHQVGIAVENSRLFAQVQNMAALEERERIAREMHDGLAQVIGFLGIKTRVVRQLVADGRLEQVESDLGQMQEIIQEAYTDIRQSILSLRTATELERGLLAAIRESANDFTEQNSIPVELALSEEGDVFFPPEAEVQLVRIVQEALANVRKHSRAGKVWIRLERREGEAILSVEDDGVGFDSSQLSGKKRRCFGLETMRERAQSIGAQFEVNSVPGEGTRVQVRFTLGQRAAEAEQVPQNPAG